MQMMESGNGNDGEVSGATLGNDRHGNSNSAYQFDGNQNHIRVSHSTSLNFEAKNSFSISAWISPHSLSGIA